MLGGALEALVTEAGGTRAPGSTPIDAQRDDTGAVIASGFTDGDGFVILSPIPANGVNAYRGTDGSLVTPKPGDRDRIKVEVPGRGSRSWNLQSEEGQYYEATIETRDVWFRRSDFTTPPFSFETRVTFDRKASWPAFSRDYRQRLTLLWTHTDGTVVRALRATSDDEGRTWSNPVVAFEGGRYGFSLDDPHTGTHLEAARVGENVQALRKRAGDLTETSFVFVDQTGAALRLANEGFAISVANEGASRWTMVCKILGETAVSRWVSGDSGDTWKRLP
jgi:hypothetical protein